MHIHQAVLPVAGLGTRFLPWTKVVPKELLPIGNQPIIALLVDECLSIGIDDICFVISRGKEAIPQYFYDMPELESELKSRGKLHMIEELARYSHVHFHVAYQEDMKGDGHALLQARDWVKKGTVAVLFGDDLIVGKENGLQQMLKAMEHLQRGGAGSAKETAMLCLQEVERKFLSRYGVVELDHEESKKHARTMARLRRVKGMVEKPKPEDAPSNFGIVGKYLIPSSLFERLHEIEESAKDGEVRLIDALIHHKKNLDIYGYVFEGTRLDTGHPEGYKEAVKMLG